MAYNLAELKTNLAKPPPRICIYGGEGEGVGKTTCMQGTQTHCA